MSPPELFPVPRRCDPLQGTVDTSVWQDLHGFSEDVSIDPELHPEGFTLELKPDTKVIRTGSPAGSAYAWTTLCQWRGSDPSRTPCVLIEDAPALDTRGFMLDISRDKVPTRASLTRWVNWLSAFRYNQLQLYTEHTFAYPGHETVWQDASPMTPDDIIWLRDLCRAHHIELVPNQNCFGHFERWIKHPAYHPFAEIPEGCVSPWGDRRHVGSVLKPDSTSLDLVAGLLDELLPLFDSDQVNIGCDETFELGKGASKDLCEQRGTGVVYTDFLLRIMDHVRHRHGRHPQFWADILLSHPDQIPRLPQDATALLWGYESSHPFEEQCQTIGRLGFKFMVCPGSSSWCSFAGRTDNMIANIRQAIQEGVTNGAVGMLLTDWGDAGHLQQEEVTAPALAWAGLQAWNPETAELEDAQTWCDRQVFDGNLGDTSAWLAAGRVSSLLEWDPGNSNALFKLFNRSNMPQERIDAITDGMLAEALAAIDGLKNPVSQREAWDQTLRNLRLPLLREQHRRRGTSVPADIEQAAQNGHEALWRTRNRSGGLADSLSMYTKTQTI